jgi:hypothetical protein
LRSVGAQALRGGLAKNVAFKYSIKKKLWIKLRAIRAIRFSKNIAKANE